jgi:hypothetical protein
MFRKPALLLALFAFASAVHAADPDGSNAAPIREAALRAHMAFLASDLLEGRGMATRGHELAAEYVAAQFAAYGLRPGAGAATGAGAGNAWMQRVPLRKSVPDLVSSTVVLTHSGGQLTALREGEGFATSGLLTSEDATIEAPVVFVGYGITAAAQHYDDYASIDARGKIVAFVGGAPASFESTLRAHYSSGAMKSKNAAAHGAVGIITFNASGEAAALPFDRLVHGARLGSMNWLEANGTPHDSDPRIVASATLSRNGADELLRGSPLSVEAIAAALKQGSSTSASLPVSARIHIVSHFEAVSSPNVIGILDGSDPRLKNEFVVYSAHLDHLGITEPVKGDAINNGALDNASGIAAMLEVARAMAALPLRPKRSILFIAVTGEEKGLRGSDYFANHPTVPAASLVADLNIDEILAFRATRDVLVIGGEHSDIGDAVTRTAARLGIAVSPDPTPGLVRFVRSDQYSFVRRGIPAVIVKAGVKGVDPAVDLVAMAKEWDATRYHAPSDDLMQPIEYSVIEQVATFDYALGLDLANGTTRPRWKAGDFFAQPK